MPLLSPGELDWQLQHHLSSSRYIGPNPCRDVAFWCLPGHQAKACICGESLRFQAAWTTLSTIDTETIELAFHGTEPYIVLDLVRKTYQLSTNSEVKDRAEIALTSLTRMISHWLWELSWDSEPTVDWLKTFTLTKVDCSFVFRPNGLSQLAILRKWEGLSTTTAHAEIHVYAQQNIYAEVDLEDFTQDVMGIQQAEGRAGEGNAGVQVKCGVGAFLFLDQRLFPARYRHLVCRSAHTTS